MNPTNFQRSFPLMLSFLVYSMVLNCMGVLILQLSRENISYTGLGALEAFKDLPIAFASLFAANYIDRFGTKIAMIFSLAIITVTCLALPFLGTFWLYKIWLALIGLGFSVVKISVFGIIRNNFPQEKELSQVMNRTEACFMIGIFFVNIGFGWLLESSFSVDWKFGFWGIALIAAFNILLVRKANYVHLVASSSAPFFSTFRKIFNVRAAIFFLIIFFIVFVEQGFSGWLPIFFKNHLAVNSYFALQSAAFMAFFSFLGRITASKLVLRISAYKILVFALSSSVFILFLCQCILSYSPAFSNVLLYLIPLTGLVLAPLYPLYNSKLLAAISVEGVSLVVSMLVIFSAIGSSLGSSITAVIFQQGNGFFYTGYLATILLFVLVLTLIFSKKIRF